MVYVFIISPYLPGLLEIHTAFYWRNLLEDSHLGDQGVDKDNITMAIKELRFYDER
jgi:hypothetical protein